jgi:hypothetical protein
MVVSARTFWSGRCCQPGEDIPVDLVVMWSKKRGCCVDYCCDVVGHHIDVDPVLGPLGLFDGNEGRVLKSSARYLLDVGEPVIVCHMGGAVGEELNLVVERGGETIELSIIG